MAGIEELHTQEEAHQSPEAVEGMTCQGGNQEVWILEEDQAYQEEQMA